MESRPEYRFPTLVELQAHLSQEWYLVKQNWKRLCFIVFCQFFHNWCTNVAYYVHTRRPILYDVGFDILPEADGIDWVNDSLFGVILFTFGVICFVPMFNRNVNNKQIFGVTIFCRGMLCVSVCIIFRCCTFLVTSLPSPSHHCRLDSTVYNPPKDWLEIFTRFDPTHGCGDLIFSGHTSNVVSVVICIIHYSVPLFQNQRYLTYIVAAVVISMTLTLELLILIARNHYSVDVVVALYVVPLVYYALGKEVCDLHLMPTMTMAATGASMRDDDANDTMDDANDDDDQSDDGDSAAETTMLTAAATEQKGNQNKSSIRNSNGIAIEMQNLSVKKH